MNTAASQCWNGHDSCTLRCMRKAELNSAAGYGPFEPVQPNDSAENKAKNRRTEITLQSNIDEFVALPTAR